MAFFSLFMCYKTLITCSITFSCQLTIFSMQIGYVTLLSMVYEETAAHV